MPVPDFSPGEVLTAAAMDQVGLWLVKTQTITSAASTQDITGCFNSDFANYRVVIEGFTASSITGTQIQMLVGSTPTTANYYWSAIEITTAGSVTGTGGNNVSSASTQIIGFTTPAGASIEFYSPQKAIRTSFTSNGIDMRSLGAPFRYASGFQDSNTQFDGFRILTGGAPTITGGTVRVYGYRN